jgi:apolipoprotein N-acyltransferase
MNLILKSLGVWLIIMLVANLNGAFREFVLKRFLRERGRRFISTVMLLAFFWIIAYFFIKWQAANYDLPSFITVGIVWLVLTLAFEFGFGHYLAHHPWKELLAEYDFTRGRIWFLVPLSTLIAPIILALIFKGAG